VSDRPFHHGSLRTALLERAEIVLRERGIDALSLRELARDVGVSHGAPRTHFVHRHAMLGALADRGFDRLALAMRTAATTQPDDASSSLLASARAYIDFAIAEPALVNLMFSSLKDDPNSASSGAGRFFGTVRELVGSWMKTGAVAGDDLDRMTLLVSAMMRGVATFAASGRLSSEEIDNLVVDAVASFAALPPRPGG
jgi:AcrR family transcriptional regulator